jgi:hypothetical protein
MNNDMVVTSFAITGSEEAFQNQKIDFLLAVLLSNIVGPALWDSSIVSYKVASTKCSD